jgi:hypothetical protein
VVTAVVFVSFFWISLVSQTHIHGQMATTSLPASRSSGSNFTTPETVESALKSPIPDNSSDDLTNCPLCQAVHQSGSFITPLISFLPIWLVYSAVHPWSVAFCGWFSFPGHDLQTRGPPRL